MKLFVEFTKTKDTNNLFSLLLAARNHAHRLHFNTKSYAQHQALGDFYDSLLSKTDELIETFQGTHDLAKLNLGEHDFSDDAEAFLTKLGNDLRDAKKLFSEDEHLGNIMDEISGLVYRTLYKIRFLK